MVVALSWADIPVVTPCLASIEIVKAVPNLASLFSTIIGRLSSATLSGVRERHISPLPYFVIKFIASGVVFSAAIIRSPSFSLSSSSTRMIILPFLMSSIASSIVLNFISMFF